MKISFKKQLVPHLVAVAVFYALTVLFFSPVFFEGKGLNQMDILQWQGSSKEIQDFREATGEEPLWTNSMFSGMPAYMIDVDWGNDIVEVLQAVYSLGLPHPVRLVFASMVSYYILLLVFGINPWLSMAGAIGFSFSSYNIIGLVAGHNARIGAIAFMPLVLAGIHKAYDGRKRLGFTLAAVGLAMHLRINHLQITYYLLLIIIAYAIARFIIELKKNQLKPFLVHSAVLVAAALLAVGTFAGEFWATYSYSKYTQRGKPELTSQMEAGVASDGLDREYAFRHSNSLLEPLVLFIPNFFGGASPSIESLDAGSETANELMRMGVPRQQVGQQLQMFSPYWGRQPGSAPYYAGAIIVFLFVLGLLVVKGPHKWWILIISLFGIMLTWGSSFASFNYFLFDYLPGYNKFRSVTFALVIPILCFPLLGFLGLQKGLATGFDKEWTKKLYVAFGICGGFALVAAILAGIGSYAAPMDQQLGQYPRLVQALREDRESLLRGDAFRSFLFVAAAGTVIFFWSKKKLSATLAPLILVALVALDGTLVSARYLNDSRFQRNPARQFFAPSAADQAILQDKGYYRVFYIPDPFNDARTSYFHHSLGGYHAAKLRRYHDLIGNCLGEEHQQVYSMLQSGTRNFGELQVVNMLNAKYFKFGESANEMVQNNAAYGPAWLVRQAEVVESADEEMALLCETDTRNMAVIDGTKFQVAARDYNNAGSIRLVSYAPNKLTYQAELEGNGMAVFSEIYYPEGWKATIDGREVPVLRANYVLRALEIPAGSHEIVVSFEPAVYEVGNKVMIGSSIVLLIVVIMVGGYQVRKMLFD